MINSKEELYRSLLIKKKEKGLKDLYFFNKYILETDKRRQDLLVDHVHGEWASWYKNSTKRIKMILVPRSTFKSTFFTVGRTIQAICQDRNNRVLIANATLANAQKFVGEMKDQVKRNETLKKLYGEFYEPKLRWNEDEFDVMGKGLGSKEANVTAVGVGGNLVSQHYSMIVCDDLVNNENSATRYQADKVIDWWKKAFSLLDYNGEMLIIGTRWSYYELYSWIQEKFKDQIDVYIRGAYKDDGKLYFPELLNEEKLKELRGLQGSYIFCNPKEAPVLMSDWTFKPISEVKVGDEVVGWKVGDFGRRTLCPSKVLEMGSRISDIVKIKMSSGRKIRCTPNHNWYTARLDATHREYKPAEVGSKLMFILNPNIQNEVLTREQKELALWFGGLYDGDGGFCGDSILMAQDRVHNPEVCEKIEYTLDKLGFNWSQHTRKHSKEPDNRGIKHSVDMQTYWLNGGLEDRVRFLNICKPSKKIKIAPKMFSNGGRFIKERDRVVSIVPDGHEKVYALQTETGNYVVWGYASSNSAFYLNDPVDESSALIKKSQIKYYGEGDATLPGNLNVFAVCDPAVSQAETADESSIIVVGVDTDDNWWILETRTGQWTTFELIEQLFAVHEQWKPITMTLEVIGQAQGIMLPIHDEEDRRKIYLPLVEITSRPQIKKEIRIRSVLQPRFERGKVFIKRDMFDLEEQIIHFPRSKRDDMIDALTDVEDIAFAANSPERPYKESGSNLQDILNKQSLGKEEYTDPLGLWD
jgi:phage terminase large subunit-like protein